MSQLLWQLLLLFCKRIISFPFALSLRIWVQLHSGVLVPKLSAGAQGLVSHPNIDVKSKLLSCQDQQRSTNFPPLSPSHPQTPPPKDWQLLVTPILASSLFAFSPWGFLYSLGSSVVCLKQCSSFFSVSSTVQQLAFKKASIHHTQDLASILLLLSDPGKSLAPPPHLSDGVHHPPATYFITSLRWKA